MNERKIISALIHDRSVLETLKPHLSDLSPEGLLLANSCVEYYAADANAKSVDTEILKSRFERTVASNKLVEVLKSIVDSLPEVSAVNVAKDLVEVKKHKLGSTIASRLLAGQHGSDLDNLIQCYLKMQGDTLNLAIAEVPAVSGIDIKKLIKDATDQTRLIKILPKALNDKLDGGMSRGHHMMIFARPEMGKSLCAINIACGLIQQKLKVLWIENEEPIEDVLIRLGSRVTGMNKYEIRDNPDKAAKLIDERIADLFTIVSLAPGTFEQIRGLTDKYKPDVVIINQLRNVDVRSENRTQALERASLEARSLAKSRNVLVVSVTQAGDSADGKRALAMGDIDSSNTGMQGPTDVILGIGATAEDQQRGIRFLTCCKNKRAGPLAHEPLQVFVDTSLSKIVEA